MKQRIPEYRDTQMATATLLRFQTRDPDPIPPWRDLGGTVVNGLKSESATRKIWFLFANIRVNVRL